MLAKIVGLLGALGIGIVIPLVALIKAFENIEKMTPWGWVTVALVSIAAIACMVTIIVISKFFKE